MRVPLRSLVLAAALIAMAAPRSPARDAGAPAEAARPGVLVVGLVEYDTKEEVREFRPLADYLAARLSGAGIRRVEIKAARSLDRMAQLMRSGEVDLYFDSPFPAAYLSERGSARPFLRHWRDGLSEYRSVIFVRKDGGIDGLSGLKGHTIALKDLFSTSGYFFPVAALRRAGLDLTEKHSLEEPVPPGRAAYMLTHDEEMGVYWVLKGLVKAAALDRRALEKHAHGRMDELKVLYESPAVPRQLALRRTDLDPRLAAAIESTLTTMHQDPAGREVLKKFHATAKFERLPQGPREALKAVYDERPQLRRELAR